MSFLEFCVIYTLIASIPVVLILWGTIIGLAGKAARFCATYLRKAREKLKRKIYERK